MKDLLLTVVICFLAGCAAPGAGPVAAGTPHGECLVCKCNNDLACVDVPIDASTPRATADGNTYYFCSDECRREFLRAPAKYTAAR